MYTRFPKTKDIHSIFRRPCPSPGRGPHTPRHQPSPGPTKSQKQIEFNFRIRQNSCPPQKNFELPPPHLKDAKLPSHASSSRHVYPVPDPSRPFQLSRSLRRAGSNDICAVRSHPLVASAVEILPEEQPGRSGFPLRRRVCPSFLFTTKLT